MKLIYYNNVNDDEELTIATVVKASCRNNALICTLADNSQISISMPKASVIDAFYELWKNNYFDARSCVIEIL